MHLVIDTATSRLSLALLDGGELAGELTWWSKQNHTAELIPSLNYLLDRAGIGLDDLGGIIVAKGPGSFTGLRVGVTTAKGLAISKGVPLVGVGTLEARAYPYLSMGVQVCALQEAGRSEVAAAIFEGTRHDFQATLAEHITTVADLCEKLPRPAILCGEISDETKTGIEEALGTDALLTDTRGLTYRAACIGELGLAKLSKGEADDPSTLQPLYLRRPSITKPKKAKKSR